MARHDPGRRRIGSARSFPDGSMSAIDVEKLLSEVSPDSPSGQDLEYDPAFMEMTRAAAGKPEQEIGGQVIPGEPPDWRDVKKRCLDLCARTRDLRVAVYLTRALAHTDGLAGFADGLALNRGLIERMWDHVHPKLDPDDDNDPTLRVNTIAGLADADSTVRTLRMLPLASSRRMGAFGLRDWEIANGTLPKPASGENVPDMTTIEAAFLDMDGPALEALAQGAGAALEATDGLDTALNMAVGVASGADLTALRTTLRTIHALLQQQLARRGLGSGEAAAVVGGASEGGMAARTGVMPAMSGPIQSREDVIRTLDQVCDWYAKYEPASPVPLLLQRAKRLVNKNFLEAVQDLTPSGVTEIQNIAGVESQ
jgi:type VI secretion system protein ImpA